MERDNLSKYNIIESRDGEYIIGYFEDLVIYFKNVAKDYIDKLSANEYDNVIEILELLKNFENAYDRGELGDDDLLEVGYNPMGAYTYCQRIRESE